MFKPDFKPVAPGLTPVFPNKCCSCLGSPETFLAHSVGTVYTQGTSRVTETTKYSLPICRDCEAHILGFRKKWGLIFGSLMLVAGAGAIAAIPLDRPKSFLIGMGVVVVLMIGFLIMQRRFAAVADQTAPLRFRNKQYQELYDQANR